MFSLFFCFTCDTKNTIAVHPFLIQTHGTLFITVKIVIRNSNLYFFCQVGKNANLYFRLISICLLFQVLRVRDNINIYNSKKSKFAL